MLLISCNEFAGSIKSATDPDIAYQNQQKLEDIAEQVIENL